MEDRVKQVFKMPNWKSSRVDYIPGFGLKGFHSQKIHKAITLSLHTFFLNEKIVNISKRFVKNTNLTFPLGRYFTSKL